MAMNLRYHATLLRGAGAMLLAMAVAGCAATDMLRAREENHCRRVLDTLGEWTGEKDDPSIESTVSARREIEGKPVSTVTISYRQGGSGRLITCTYAADGEGPVLDVIYKNVHLTDDDLKRLNEAVN